MHLEENKLERGSLDPELQKILTLPDEEIKRKELTTYITQQVAKYGYVDEQIINRFNFEPAKWSIGDYWGYQIVVYDKYKDEYLKEGRSKKGFVSSTAAIEYLREKYRGDSGGAIITGVQKDKRNYFHLTNNDDETDSVTICSTCPLEVLDAAITVVRLIYNYCDIKKYDDRLNRLEKSLHDKYYDEIAEPLREKKAHSGTRWTAIKKIIEEEGYTWEYPATELGY